MLNALKRKLHIGNPDEAASMDIYYLDKLLFIAEASLQDGRISFLFINPKDVLSVKRCGNLSELLDQLYRKGGLALPVKDFKLGIPGIVSVISYKGSCSFRIDYEGGRARGPVSASRRMEVLLTFRFRDENRDSLSITCEDITCDYFLNSGICSNNLSERMKALSNNKGNINDGENILSDPEDRKNLAEDDVAAEKEAEGDPDLSGLGINRILLAEDEEHNMETMCSYLDRLGINHDECYDGEELCAVFEGSEPGYYDMILADVGMAYLDGVSAALKIRSMQRPDSDLPFAAVSGDISLSEQKRFRESGIDSWLGKPYSIRDLAGVIQQLAGKTAGD